MFLNNSALICYNKHELQAPGPLWSFSCLLFSLPCIPLSFPRVCGGSRPSRYISQIFHSITVLSFEISARTTEKWHCSAAAERGLVLSCQEGRAAVPAMSCQLRAVLITVLLRQRAVKQHIQVTEQSSSLPFFTLYFMLLGIFFCCCMAVTGHVNPGL